jgi:hypothetical protein
MPFGDDRFLLGLRLVDPDSRVAEIEKGRYLIGSVWG